VVLVAVVVVAAAAGLAWILFVSLPPAPTDPRSPTRRPTPAAPGAPPAAAGPQAAAPQAAEPVVPIDLPTPRPGLDRALSTDYRRALEGQGFRIAALTIIDSRAAGGVRRAEIVYRSAGGSTVEALRPEIVRVIGPGANPRLALDQIVVRATRPDGKAVAMVTVTVADLDRWLKAQITDAEFYSRWTIGPPAR
jgi:hypothetical protein